MKRAVPLILLLTGCGATPLDWATGGIAAGIGSIAVMGRTPVDAAVSLIKGQDCSLVRLDRGQSYCRPEEAPPEEPPFCTRSLGRVDCWADPQSLPGNPVGVADGPKTLTPAQEADRKKGWLF